MQKNDLFFTEIEKEKLGSVDIMIVVFKIRSKIRWLKENNNTVDNMKLYKVEMENNKKPNSMRRNGNLSLVQIKNPSQGDEIFG